MHLTTFSDYSIRVLICLGLRRSRLATIADIARAYHIPENHLMKVVHQPVRHGYIGTVRGKGGGLPDIQPACSLTGFLREAQEALYAVLQKYTLADLMRHEPALAQILIHHWQAADKPEP